MTAIQAIKKQEAGPKVPHKDTIKITNIFIRNQKRQAERFLHQILTNQAIIGYLFIIEMERIDVKILALPCITQAVNLRLALTKKYMV